MFDQLKNHQTSNTFTLGTLDLTLFGGSLAITVFIGLYFANKNKTFADYARGGGNQNLWAVSTSMAAGYCSALSLIGNPSELYMHGTSFTLKMGVTILVWPISSFILLPIFRLLDGISIFQYIELRYSPALRRFISLIFIGQMLFYAAITLYLPSLPLYAALKIPQTISIGLVGLICIVYSSFGGIKAVTWTNFYHTILLIFAMLAILVIGTIECGGLGKVWSDSLDGGRWSLGQQYWQLDLTTRHTIFNTLLSYPIIRLFLHGTSQMQIQSALSLSTMRRSQASLLLSAIIYFLLQIVASAIGLVLYVAYRDCDPFASGEIKRQDELLVHFISSRLASSSSQVPAIQGLFLAAVFGSTLTSMSSFLSSTSAMIVEDFVRPTWTALMSKFAQCQTLKLMTCHSSMKSNKEISIKQNTTLVMSDELAATIGKLVSLLLGLSCIMLTFEMDKISGLQQAATTMYGVVGAPIVATFLMGAMTRQTNTTGIFCGLLVSIIFGLWVLVNQLARAHPLEASLAISTSACDTHLKQTNLTALTDGELDDQVKIVVSSFGANIAKNYLNGTNDYENNYNYNNNNNSNNNSSNYNYIALSTSSNGPVITSAPTISTLAQLNEMSYLWLPLFTFSLTVLVAYLVSLITKEPETPFIDENLLAPCIRQNYTAEATDKLAISETETKSPCKTAIKKHSQSMKRLEPKDSFKVNIEKFQSKTLGMMPAFDSFDRRIASNF